MNSQLELKARAYRCVFRRDLKISMVGASLTWEGSAFHKVGPATEKARSPLVFFVLPFGGSSFNWPVERKDRGGL